MRVEALVAIAPVDPLVVQLVPRPSQTDVGALIALAPPRLCNPPSAMPQKRMVVPRRAIADRRAVQPQRRSAPPLANPVGFLELPDQLAPTTRLQSFFAITSCNIALSRLRSTTSCLSLRFSSSSCFSRRSSPTPRTLIDVSGVLLLPPVKRLLARTWTHKRAATSV